MIRTAVRVLGTVFRRPSLRRVELAFAAFNAAEWGVWIAMLVYAYEQGGATEAGLVALAQLVPAGLFAPFAAVLADRFAPVRVLAAGYVVQSAAMAATAAALLAEAPPLAAYALAAVAATAVTLTRPTQAVLLPLLSRSADELTAANVASGWIESISVLAAPAATGVILAVSGPGTVFAVMAAAVAIGAVLAAGVDGPAAPRAATESAAREALAGFVVLVREPPARLLVLLLAVQFVVIGALDVLYVVLALDEFDAGESWAGYLNAAFGAGGVMGVALTAALVGRARLMPAVLAGVAAWSVAFVVLAAEPTLGGALLLIAAAGAARVVVDVAGRTLLQRTTPPDVLSRVFGVLEGLTMAGLAVGSLLAPAAVAVAGGRGAIAVVAAVLPLTVLALGRRLVAVDRAASVPVTESALLRAVPLFSALDPPTVERLARSAVHVTLHAGEDVVREGETADGLYVVVDGELDVAQNGRRVRGLARADAFGEIGVLLDVPRTATVTARTYADLLELRREPFLTALGAHPAHARAAAADAHELASHDPGPRPSPPVRSPPTAERSPP